MLLFDAFPAHLSFPHVAGAISPPDTLTRESQAASGLKGSFLMYLPRPSLCCQGAYNCSKSSPSWRSHTSRDSGSLTSFSLARMKQDVGVVSRSRSGAEISSLLMVLERSLGAPGAWMACESPSLHHHGAFLSSYSSKSQQRRSSQQPASDGASPLKSLFGFLCGEGRLVPALYARPSGGAKVMAWASC